MDKRTTIEEEFTELNSEYTPVPASEYQVGGNHYKNMVIQPSEFIYANSLNWLEGNAVKYICRHALKGGKDDLLKAIHYIELLLEWEYGDEKG